MSTALTGDHFFPGASNSRIDWRVNLARANRDEPDLRETLYQQPFLAGTTLPNPAVTPVLADESQSGFRLFNNLDDETIDLAVNYGAFKTTGARPTQFKFGVNYVERTRDFESRRFRFIPIVATKDGAPPVNLTQAPEAALRLGQHRHGVPLQRRDAPGRRLRRRADDHGRLRHGRHGVVGAQPADCRRPRRALRTDRQHVRPVRPVRAHDHGREQEHRHLPGGQLRAVGRRQSEPPPELQHDRQPAGVPRAGRVRVHRRRRQPRHARQPRPGARADSERRRPLGTVPGRPQRRLGEHLLQVLRPADRARRDRLGQPDHHLPERRQGPQLRRRVRDRASSWAAASSSTPTTRSSTRRSRCCPSSRRCRPRWSGRSPASRRTSST